MYPRLKMEETPYSQVATEVSAPEFQLTVITVCWNALADLKPTVESVLRQKAKGNISIEHVVVDGSSTDGTPEWLAGQLAAGNIERYVSEPDCGIYDAMNKGINMARGEVLAFLNAGDTYTEEDLAPCVLPICKGVTYGVAAYANWINCATPFFKPSYDQLFFACPCCHQSYFASARAYREVGGYDAPAFRCSADTDMMYRMYRKWGEPIVSTSIVVNFPVGGLSSNCRDVFRHEHVEMLWRNWDLIEKRAAEELDFKLLLEAFLAEHCYQFRDWQQRHGKRIPAELSKLQTMCRQHSQHARSLYAKLALRWLAGRFLPVLIEGRECSPLLLRLTRFWIHALHLPEENKYRHQFYHLRITPLDISAMLRKILKHN